MTTLLTGPPPAEVLEEMRAIEGLTITPAVINRQTGPEGHLGPESAGAILVLQATFVDRDRFDQFWHQVAEMMRLLATAPGFIRRFTFADGPHYTLIALWHTVEDAHALFACEEHQAAMKQLFENRWQYTHFAGLWQTVAPRRRLIFCQDCEGIGHSGDPRCPSCGTELDDPLLTAASIRG